ncbi:phosphatase PAP2 family protein [bacterium]|nr:MAG: phosphatase PAP2 family protein [bacterium]
MERLARHAQALVSRLTARRLLVAGLAYVLPAALLVYTLGEAVEREYWSLDPAILLWLHQFANPNLDWLMRTITNLGDVPVIMLTAAVLCLALYDRRRYRSAAVVIAGVMGAAAFNLVLKSLFARDRPDLWHQVITVGGYSFPSGHAMASASLAMATMVALSSTRYRQAAWIIGPVYLGLVGLSRCYLGCITLAMS